MTAFESRPARIALTRRSLLAGGAALTAAQTLPGALAFAAAPPAAGLEATPLTAGRARAHLLEPGAPETELWGFGGSVPGPVLRVRQGEELAILLQNDLEQPTAVHWHGIRIDNAMDGVVGLTQEAIAPGTSFEYRFTPPDAGTFWYHSHNRSWEQMARGLYGLLIVEEPDAPEVDRELLLVADDWRLDEIGAIHEESLGSLRDASHAGRLGNVLTLNSKDFLEESIAPGERLRLRLCNTANARILALEFTGHRPWTIAVDGQPVTPRPLDGPLTLAPGQRADLILDGTGEPGSRHAILAHTGGQTLEIGALNYAQEPRRDAADLGPVPALPPSKIPTPRLEGAREIRLVMEGGAMGRMQSARLGEEELAIRDLVERGYAWSFNGIAGRPTDPWVSARQGETLVAEIVNETAWPHVIHTHGHHFLTLEADGSLPADPVWRDGVLLEREETKKIAFVADNPGRWLIHCHMLEHQAAGMVTWFEVT
ncbi:MAG: multicopper oxidase family protein [Limibacillus sp.]